MTLNFSNNKVYVIAEIGVNHNGNLTLAKKLINAAKNIEIKVMFIFPNPFKK